MDGEAIFHCKHCGAAIGVDNGATLTVGCVKFILSITMFCLLCGKMIKWFPGVKISISRTVASKDVAPDAPPGVEL